MAAVEITNADAVHPGYGFLAENADFAQVCGEYDIKFIGPTPEMIKKMGDKVTAKDTMIKAGVPVVPGSDGLVKNVKEGKKISGEIGYPVIIKATAGGGGKGMRIVWSEEEFEGQWNMARNEAKASFGNDGIYIEKFIEEPRHIEIQIIGDQHGTVVHLSERDCSIQRRHQKLVEECPSPFMTDELREKMGEAAKVAAGEKLSGVNYYPQLHCIECRINAEDPYKDFRPSPGHIEYFHSPKGHGVRVDTHAYAGYTVPPYYDSMIAKLICRAETREECITKMERALDEFVIEGVETTVPFHRQLMQDERFRNGDFHTGFLNDFDLK